MAHLPLVFIVFFFLFQFLIVFSNLQCELFFKSLFFLLGDYFVQRRVRDAIIRVSTLKTLFENWRLIRFENYNPVEYRQVCR